MRRVFAVFGAWVSRARDWLRHVAYTLGIQTLTSSYPIPRLKGSFLPNLPRTIELLLQQETTDRFVVHILSRVAPFALLYIFLYPPSTTHHHSGTYQSPAGLDFHTTTTSAAYPSVLLVDGTNLVVYDS